ncbi:PDZ and LIM domain protein 7-like isoform X2 [Liolophura sinensis]|uniref:PDZ and LIM domain protein 7-like isoform X2 n=1 Tax=Liolophura sinensis TaxID=3198878 RepID=UPI0031590CCE
MSVLNLEAKLERVDPSTPWGFRMQGGKDFSSALTIQRVNPGSLAAKCGLQVGDIILKIGNISTDILRHKEAQDMIIASGDKLDLLLQRGGQQAPATYEKFNAPSIFSLQNQQTPYSSQQNYNAAPKPFTPGGGSAVDNLSGRLTQGLSLNSPLQSQINSSLSTSNTVSQSPKPKYQATYDKYADLDDERDSSQPQGKSFKRLQGLMESGEAPSSALRPIPKSSSSSVQNRGLSKSPETVKAVMNSQYNTPIGLYSGANVITTFKGQAKALTGEDVYIPGGDEKASSNINKNSSNGNVEDMDEFGRKKYHPSETFRMVQEQESGHVAQEPDTQGRSKAFKLLEQKLEGNNPPPPPAPGPQPPWAQSKSTPAPSSNRGWQPSSAMKSGAAQSSGQGPMRGRKGDAVTNPGQVGRQPICSSCGGPVRGPFVMAMGKTWCPDHFVCANPQCGVKLIDIGFVEEGGFLYCERDYAQHFAPHCKKCSAAIIGECVNALGGQWHPGCFVCHHCKKPIGGNTFHQEDGKPYCEDDWNRMFQTMCYGCDFPIEPGDRWVEAMNKNWHAECFNCQHCQVNLEGQPFFPKGGKPFCKKHMRP